MLPRSAARNCDQMFQPRRRGAAVERFRADRDAFLQVCGTAGHDQRRRGVQQRDVAIGARLAVEHVLQRDRVGIGVAALERVVPEVEDRLATPDGSFGETCSSLADGLGSGEMASVAFAIELADGEVWALVIAATQDERDALIEKVREQRGLAETADILPFPRTLH